MEQERQWMVTVEYMDGRTTTEGPMPRSDADRFASRSIGYADVSAVRGRPASIYDWLQAPLEDDLQRAVGDYTAAGVGGDDSQTRQEQAAAYWIASQRYEEGSPHFAPEYVEDDRFDGDPMGTLADYR